MSTNSHLSDILRRADMEMLRGDWERAEPLYQEACALAPHDPRVEMGLQNVRRLAEKAAKIEKRMADAEALFAQGDYRGAELEYIGIMDFAVNAPRIMKFSAILEQNYNRAKSLRTWQERVRKILQDVQPMREQENWEAAAKLTEEMLQQMPDEVLYQPLRDTLTEAHTEALTQEDQRALMNRALELLRAKDYEQGIALLENIPPDSPAYDQAQRFLNQARNYLAEQKRDLGMVEIAINEGRLADALAMLEQWRGRYQDTALWRQFYLQAGLAHGRVSLEKARQLVTQHDYNTAHRQFEKAQAVFEKVQEVYPAHLDAKALRRECVDLAAMAALQAQAQLDWDAGKREEAARTLEQAQQQLKLSQAEGRDYTTVSVVVETMLNTLQDEIARIREDERRLREAESQLSEHHLGEAHRLFMATQDALLPEHQQQALAGLRHVEAQIRQFEALMARGSAAKDPLVKVDAYQDAYTLWAENREISLLLEYALIDACAYELEAGRLANAADYGNRALLLNPDSSKARDYIAKIGIQPQVEATVQRVRNEWAILQRQEILEPSAFDPLIQDLEAVLRKVVEWPDLRTDLENLHTLLRDARERRQQYSQYYSRALPYRDRGLWTEALAALEQAVAALGDTVPDGVRQQLTLWRETTATVSRARDEIRASLDQARVVYEGASKGDSLAAIVEELEATQHALAPARQRLEDATQQTTLAGGLLPEELRALQKQIEELDDRIVFVGDAIRAVSASDGLLKLQEFIRIRGSDPTVEAAQKQLTERARENINLIQQQAQLALQTGDLVEAEEKLRQIRALAPLDVENAQLYASVRRRRTLEEKLHTIEHGADSKSASSSPVDAMKTWRQGLNVLLEPDAALPKPACKILNQLLALGDRDDGLALGKQVAWKTAQEQLAMLQQLPQDNWAVRRAQFFAERWLKLARDNALRGIVASATQLGDFTEAYRAALDYFKGHQGDVSTVRQLTERGEALLNHANESANKRIKRAEDALTQGDYKNAFQALDDIETSFYGPIEQEFPELLEDERTQRLRRAARSLRAEAEKQRALHAEIEPRLESARQAYLNSAWSEAEYILNTLPALPDAPWLVEQAANLRRQISQAWVDDVRGRVQEVRERIETACQLASVPEQFEGFLRELRELPTQLDWRVLPDEDRDAYTQFVLQIEQLRNDLVAVSEWEQKVEDYMRAERYIDALQAITKALNATREGRKKAELSIKYDHIEPLARTQQERETEIELGYAAFDRQDYTEAQRHFDKADTLGADVTDVTRATRAGAKLLSAQRWWNEENDASNALADLYELGHLVENNPRAQRIAEDADALRIRIETVRQDNHAIQRELAEARQLLVTGQFSAAQDTVKNVLRRAPFSEEARTLQTQIQEQEKSHGILENARSAHQAGKYKEALQLIETILKKQPDSLDARLLKRQVETAITADETFFQVETLAKQMRFKDARDLLLQLSRQDVDLDRFRQTQQQIEELEKEQWTRIVHPIQEFYRDGEYAEAWNRCKQATEYTTAPELLDELQALQILIVNRWTEKLVQTARAQLQKRLEQEQWRDLEVQLDSLLHLEPPPEDHWVRQLEDLLRDTHTRRLRLSLAQAQAQYEVWLTEGMRGVPQSALDMIKAIQEEVEILGTQVEFDITLDAASLANKIEEVLSRQEAGGLCTEYSQLLTEAQSLRAQWDNPDYLREQACDRDLERICELVNMVCKIPGHENDEEAHELLSWVAQERSLYAQVRRFLKNAGFTVTAIENTLIYQCTPALPDLQELLPEKIYVRVLLDRPLDSTQVWAIHDEVQKLTQRIRTILVVTDQRPTVDGWAQIGTLGMRSFVILPLEQALLRHGLLKGEEHDLLFGELENRLGVNYDPYDDARGPIAGIFSFFGRDKLTQDLSRRIVAGKPVAIFGLRKMGKSSLLRALADRISFPIAFMNLQGMVNAKLEEIYRDILRQWRQWSRVHYNLAYDLPQFDSSDTTSKFKSATLELLNRLEMSTGKARLGLFLDEAEVIVPRPDGSGPDLERYLALMGAIRELVDNDKRLSLVIASLNPCMNRINDLNGRQNPMFNYFQEVYLPPLAREDCIQMVRNLGSQVRQGILNYTEASVEAIVNLGGGHPFLTRQFCSLLYQQHDYQPGEITIKAIPIAVEHFIYDEKTITHLDASIWEDAGKVALWGEMQAHVNQAILLDIARANEPLTRENLLATSEADARRTALINLERFHFIYQPEPGFYALQYGLLRTWLRRRRLGLE